MQYNPKLKKAIEEIKAILKKHDIAGAIVLHAPQHSEYLVELSPSYSCAKFEGDNLRVKAKKKDFPDFKSWETKVSSTSNMLHHLSENTGRIFRSLQQVSEMVDSVVKAEHGSGSGHSSHTQQNN